MAWIDSDYAKTLTPTITGGLGSGPGQNNPGGAAPYEPPQTYGPSVEYAPSNDPTGRYARYNGGEWEWENTPYDPSYVQPGDADLGIGGSVAQMPGFDFGSTYPQQAWANQFNEIPSEVWNEPSVQEGLANNPYLHPEGMDFASGLNEVAQEFTPQVYYGSPESQEFLRRQGYMDFGGEPLYAPRDNSTRAVLGRTWEGLNRPTLPEDWTNRLPWGIEQAAESASSPLGLASIATGGIGGLAAGGVKGALTGAARGGLSEFGAGFGATAAQEGADALGVDNPYANLGLMLAGGIAGGTAGFKAPDVATSTPVMRGLSETGSALGAEAREFGSFLKNPAEYYRQAEAPIRPVDPDEIAFGGGYGSSYLDEVAARNGGRPLSEIPSGMTPSVRGGSELGGGSFERTPDRPARGDRVATIAGDEGTVIRGSNTGAKAPLTVKFPDGTTKTIARDKLTRVEPEVSTMTVRELARELDLDPSMRQQLIIMEAKLAKGGSFEEQSLLEAVKRRLAEAVGESRAVRAASVEDLTGARFSVLDEAAAPVAPTRGAIGIEGTPAPTRSLFGDEPLVGGAPVSGKYGVTEGAVPPNAVAQQQGPSDMLRPRTDNPAAPNLEMRSPTSVDGLPSAAGGRDLPTNFREWTGRIIDEAANAGRSILVMLDLGTSGLQGWADMLTNPGRWVKGVGNGIKALGHPKVLQEQMVSLASRADTLSDGLGARLKAAGLQAFGANTTDVAESFLERIPIAGKIFRGDRRVFEGMSHYWRGEAALTMARAQIDINEAKGLGRIITDKQVRDIVSVANHRTGTTFTHANPVVNFALFAPRFYASTFALIGDSLTKGGVAGSTARKTLIQATAITVGATFATNLTISGGRDLWGPGLGRDVPQTREEWDTLFHKGNFMKVRVGDKKFSLFGPHDFVGRLFFKELGNVLMKDKSGAYIDAFRTVENRLSPAMRVIEHGSQAAYGIRQFDVVEELKNNAPLSLSTFAFMGQGIKEVWEGDYKKGGLDLLAGAMQYSAFPRSSDVTDYDKLNEDIAAWAAKNGLTRDDGKPITEWGQLDRGQRQQAEAAGFKSPEFKPFGTTNPKDAVTDAAFANYNATKDEASGTLRKAIDAGAKGKDLRDAIGEFKDTVRIAGNTALRDVPEATADSKRDLYGSMYWSAQAPEKADGSVDFDALDAARARILEEAKAAGVDPAYIMGKGEGTYRGLRYTDPVIRDAIFKLEDHREALDGSGFWEIRDGAWEDFKKKYPQQLGGFGTYSEWYEASIELEAQKLRGQGVDERLVEERARAVVSGYNTTDVFSEFWRTQYRHQWVVDNKDLAIDAVYWGYFDPDAAEEKFLGMRAK